MRQILFALALAGGVSAAALVGGTSEASARDYAYCLQGDGYGVPGDCSYDTYEQCRASASGRRADCNVNPAYAYRARAYDDDYAAPRRGYSRRAGPRSRY